jgi:hypothetical protein
VRLQCRSLLLRNLLARRLIALLAALAWILRLLAGLLVRLLVLIIRVLVGHEIPHFCSSLSDFDFHQMWCANEQRQDVYSDEDDIVSLTLTD